MPDPSKGQDEVLGFLMRAPQPEQISAFHASETAQQRLRYLLNANRAELEDASQINHFVLRLKAKARQILRDRGG